MPLTLLLVALLFLAPAKAGEQDDKPPAAPAKKYDLVLLHGLANWHRFSDAFLEACVSAWGSDRVFVVYTSQDTPVHSKRYPDGTVVFSGSPVNGAGTASIANQAAYLEAGLVALTQEHGLREPFSIIAHSMGGLVARKYIHDHPGRVAALLTLGTPHHGSPLAESFQWTGFFIGSRAAIEDLKPASMRRFNSEYPVEEMCFADGGRMYTARGDADGTDTFGWTGELLAGWQLLSTLYETDSDGLVPHASAVIEGSDHIADFPDFDHYDLVREPEVVLRTAIHLP